MRVGFTATKDLRYLIQGTTLEVLLDQAPEDTDSVEAAPEVRLGIAMMTKRPACLPTWLHYHATALHCCHRIYIRVEDTPGIEPLLRAWAPLVVATFHEGTPSRDNSMLGARQAVHVAESIRAARSDGLSHLLHIDDDELLYLPRGLDAFLRAIGHAPCAASLHVRTMEALVPSARCTDPFAEATCFRHRPWEFGSYGYPPSSGKSIGVLACAELCPNGPHHFGRTDEPLTGEPLAAGGSATLPHGAAVILHYESATYARWRDKFGELVTRADAAAKAAKFSPFYSESVRAMQRVRALEARGHPPAHDDARDEGMPGGPGGPPEEASERIRERKAAERHSQGVWRGWRVAPPLPAAPAAGQDWRVHRHQGLTVLRQPAAMPLAGLVREEAETVARHFEFWSTLRADG